MSIPQRIAVLAALFCSAVLAQGAPDPTKSEPDLKTLLRQRIDEAKSATCIVAGIIDESGEKVIACGTLKGIGGPPADGDTIFEIGSATKAFTGLLLADAVQCKTASLDDPVAKFLPLGNSMPPARGRPITLLDLATHTSGLPRLPDNMSPKDPANPYADYSAEKMYAFLSAYHLPRDAGARFEYSNLGVGLLGHVLALQAHSDYGTLVIQRIADPLGMSATRITLTPEMKARLAQGHGADGQPAANWDLGALAGAGGIRSSVNDMLKFLAANLALRKSDLWRAMELSQQPRHDAGSANMDVGLCWHIAKSPTSNVVWHNGETAGYHAFMAFDPKRKRGVVVLANSADSIDDLGFHLLDPGNPLRKIKQAAQRKSVELAPDVLDRYVGRYELTPTIVLEVRRDGRQLQAQLTGQPWFPIYPEAETEFFYKVVDAQVSFVKDQQGTVTGLVIHQNGIDQPAKKRTGQ